MNMESENGYFGFIGKILRIDLTEKSIMKEDLNRNYANGFLGGAGYGQSQHSHQDGQNGKKLPLAIF